MKTKSNIKQLPKVLADQIAAGEVIEGPASVVKELVENAIDAGATKIQIRLREGGCEEIQVIDNGHGMNKADLAICVERYATSKITSFKDLLTLTTHGFRGEALAAMAAVSRIHIQTATQEDTSTSCVMDVDPVSGKNIYPAAYQPGTSIRVQHLFSWVPARKKHLKTPRAEVGRCHRALWPLMLMHPQIHFELDLDATQKSKLVPSVKDMKDRYFMLLPMHHERECFRVAFEHQDQQITVEGFLSNPLATVGDSRHVFVAINHRFVRVPAILAMLRKIFQNVDGKRGYPWGVLKIQMPSHEIDFNVDPKKETVRLVNQNRIVGMLQTQLACLMAEGQMISPTFSRPSMQSWDPSRFSNHKAFKEPEAEQPTFNPDSEDEEGPSESLHCKKKDRALSTEARFDFTKDVPSSLTEVEAHPDQVNWLALKSMGVMDGLIICAHDDEHVYFLDQHAIHERINYEKYLCHFKEGKVSVQKLLIPESQSVDAETWEKLQDHQADLTALGFDLGFDQTEDHHQVNLHACPVYFDQATVLSQLIKWVHTTNTGELNYPLHTNIERFLGDLACKRSIKAGHAMQPEEINHLFKEAHQWVDTKICCQHGRPFVMKLPLKSIYESFYRTQK